MTETTARPDAASFKEKQADDLLTGLLFYETDLGSVGKDLVQMMLSTRQANLGIHPAINHKKQH